MDIQKVLQSIQSIWEWVSYNSAWLFSGAGVAIITVVIKIFFGRKKDAQRQSNIKDNIVIMSNEDLQNGFNRAKIGTQNNYFISRGQSMSSCELTPSAAEKLDLIKDLEVGTVPAFKSFTNASHSHFLYLTSQPATTGKEFSHRDETVEELYKAIKQNRRLALINGIGGIGKTTVARALFHKAKNEFKHIAWVEYQNNIKDSLLSSFTIFDDIKNEDTERRYRRIEDFLRSASKDTLIFVDNVTDDGGVDLIERFDVNVVITSRMENIGNFEAFPIDFLDKEQCIDIFYKYYDYKKYDKEKKHKDAVCKLVDLVKCHTLSVELLARAANRPGYPLDVYEKELRGKGFGYPDRGVITEHSRNFDNSRNSRRIAEHLVKLFELIEVSPEQQRILRNFSVMPSVVIPAEVERWLGCDINDIMRLAELGWLDTGSGVGYYMHPIIKEEIRLQHNAQYEDCEALIRYMSRGEYIKETDVYTEVNDRLNVAEAVMKCFRDVEKEEIGLLFHNIAAVNNNQGEYDKALEWYQKALNIREKILGPDHPDTAATYNNIAAVYSKQGEYNKALEWYQKALNIDEKILGPDHPSTATTYNNIALVYNNQGEYDKALEWYLKSFYILRNRLGINHPRTSAVIKNMQYAYTAHYGEDSNFVEWLESRIYNYLNNKT